MDRRGFLRATGLATAAVAGVALASLPAEAQDPCSGSSVKGFWGNYRAYCPNHGWRGNQFVTKSPATSELRWHRLRV